MLIKVRKEDLEKAGIPYKQKTLYKWHTTNKHPEIFVKIDRSLFINSEKWEELVRKKIKENEMKVSKLYKKENGNQKQQTNQSRNKRKRR